MPPSTRRARRRPPTLRDVAEIADVSIKTVSNVVHDYPHVRESTRTRVQEAIAATGYRPQLAAQQLRTGASGIVTLAVPSLNFSYFSNLAQTFIDEAQGRGRTVVLHTTSAGRDEEIEVLRGFRRRLGDGVIFNPMQVGEDYLAQMEHVDQPTVFIGEHLSDAHLPPGSDYVRIDNTRATADATAHLLERGRRRLAFVGAMETTDPAPHSSSGLRIEGFRQALWRHDLDPARAPIEEVADWHRADGREAAHRLLDAHPHLDGLVCGNDEIALGALAGLRDRGRTVPGDVAVVGYDDSPEALFAHPPLTTIRPDKQFLVKAALDMLIERINGYEGAPRTITAPHELVVRGSTPEG
ncbi:MULTISPECIES: LacI family DNA-binding transcriptional regulator [Brachybacterium]|uniref:LacI family DNA-binding transcriptional regulator n=1 Tax=Brachybacterium halotolerans TaxID=2795215 RepID=A0ABS1BD96_9MICO|nr:MULTISPECIES: LacI family DNA-binding transcriptional regulator [Brachybacterium]MBK0332629.1 LacI family DNA-binding transcriptional regulator [Brachybacterium halotolerans]MCG7309563.1 LacI family transcriptional regulator [Brachybacterium sp. ACRRE]